MRKFLVWGCFLFIVFWLAHLFLPQSASDTYGYDRLWSLIVLSLCHFLVGGVLLLFVPSGESDFGLGLSMLAAPMAHFIGSSNTSDLSLVFFVMPSALSVYFGIRALKATR